MVKTVQSAYTWTVRNNSSGSGGGFVHSRECIRPYTNCPSDKIGAIDRWNQCFVLPRTNSCEKKRERAEQRLIRDCGKAEGMKQGSNIGRIACTHSNLTQTFDPPIEFQSAIPSPSLNPTPILTDTHRLRNEPISRRLVRFSRTCPLPVRLRINTSWTRYLWIRLEEEIWSCADISGFNLVVEFLQRE